jgi:DNA-binding NtrC family response regulator
MKRILVIDESEVVRETLALILGSEFVILKRPLLASEFPVSDAREVDLLILGVTPQLGLETASLLRLAARLPAAVLFLVESKAVARAIESKAQIACLTKPFNPHELCQKVGQLLARRADLHKAPQYKRTDDQADDFSRYLEFPYLGRSAASVVRRFAAARLPLLITGETGCGQSRVAAGICALNNPPGLRLFLNAIEVSEEYLSQKALDLSLHSEYGAAPTTVLIENLDKTSPSGQALIESFIDEAGEKLPSVRYLTTSNAGLLERVYRGEFLDSLYYKLATLTLQLSPLRERRDEIPIVAEWFARVYAKKLGLDEPVLSQDAKGRLSNYLWFGNLSELETVIARTLAFHGKSAIEDADLIFDFTVPQPSGVGDFTEFVPVEARPERQTGAAPFEVYSRSPVPHTSTNGHATMADLNVLIHELAHELKNPMVTIKTFAQLLGDRYHDENFRNRFQEVVGNDIERMDDLLEVMIEFADFAPPRLNKVALGEKVRSVLTDIRAESAKRQMRFEWKGNGPVQEIEIDESQLEYILKNILLVTLSDARMGSEIEIALSGRGTLTITYQREGARVASISHYLSEQSSAENAGSLPLRVLLAKHLLERNSGRFVIHPPEGEKETLRLEFPVTEHRNEN